MLEIYSTGEGGTAGSGKPPVIDKTMAKRIATQLNWAPIDNAEWNYNPVTGEPLVEGWPLYSGLPQYGTEDPQYQHDPRQKILMSEKNIQISDTKRVESAHLKGHTMNDEYTPGEAEAWINGYSEGKKTKKWVDLEDEEIEQIARYADKHAAPFHLEFARAIIRQLKERNT